MSKLQTHGVSRGLRHLRSPPSPLPLERERGAEGGVRAIETQDSRPGLRYFAASRLPHATSGDRQFMNELLYRTLGLLGRTLFARENSPVPAPRRLCFENSRRAASPPSPATSGFLTLYLARRGEGCGPVVFMLERLAHHQDPSECVMTARLASRRCQAVSGEIFLAPLSSPCRLPWRERRGLLKPKLNQRFTRDH